MLVVTFEINKDFCILNVRMRNSNFLDKIVALRR